MDEIDVILALKAKLADKRRPTLRETARLIALSERLIDAEHAARAEARLAGEYGDRLSELIASWNGLLAALRDHGGIEVISTAGRAGWQARIDGSPAGPTFSGMVEAYAWALHARLDRRKKAFTGMVDDHDAAEYSEDDLPAP